MNRVSKYIGGVLLGVLILSTFLMTKPAQALDLGFDNIAASGTVVDPCLNTGGAFGFVFCPAVDSFADVIDYFLSVMQSGFNWSYLGENSNLNVLDVWSSILPIANILFAVIFMFVIYSVATGQGLNNYSIKKIMPRLIIVAIAINVSGYICAALIDISNIVGESIYDLVSNTLYSGANGVAFSALADNVFNNSGAGVNLRVGSSGAIGALLLLVSNMTIVLLAVSVVFVSIAARNVILMLLLLSSPLAFSTALLPNTENIFRKWGNNFLRLLVIYPAFMFVWAICRGLQNAFLNSDADAMQLILAMLLSVAPVIVIVPLFKGAGNLTGKVNNLVQRGTTGLSSNPSIQIDNKKMNNHTIDQINQKKFTNNNSNTSNTSNVENDIQSTLLKESNSSLSNRATLAADGINVEASGEKKNDRKSNRSRALATNLKSKITASNEQNSNRSSLRSMNNIDSSSQNINTNNANSAISADTIFRQNHNNNASNLHNSSQSGDSINNNNASTITNNALEHASGGDDADKLADAIKSNSINQGLTRERVAPVDKAKTPTPRKEMFAEGVSEAKKDGKVFDVSTKGHTTNVFSGEGQNVSIDNNGETSQVLENAILDNGAITDSAPSIIPNSENVDQANDEPIDSNNIGNMTGNEINQLTESVHNKNNIKAKEDNVIASAPSIVNSGIISDVDRQNRFIGKEGQKELASMLTIANIRQFLPSDIGYILGIGPLLSKDGKELASIRDIEQEPEYQNAVQIISSYISTLSEDEKSNSDIIKWQKKLGLLK
jgi:TrbL/VirB6 plasmid conjugal transfer protein.